MNTQIEIIDHLRQKIKEVGKKSSARRVALKRLEAAYKITNEALNQCVDAKIRYRDLYEATLKDYSKLQLEYKELQEQFDIVQEERRILSKLTKPKTSWKFWA